MTVKTKKTQKKKPEESNNRDNFLTPAYATKLLLPYIPKNVKYIWECCAGEGHMARIFEKNGYDVYKTDIRENLKINVFYHNFLSEYEFEKILYLSVFGCIITNPAFSIKAEVYAKCKEYESPFALLIPSDISGWVLKAFEKDGAQVIVPSRRIDYLTPNIISRINTIINKKESVLEKKDLLKKKLLNGLDIKKEFSELEEIPAKVLRAFSSSDFHSWWLTYGFNLPKQINIVDLTNEMKNDIF